MLDGIKRFFSGGPGGGKGAQGLAAWAESHQYVYRSVPNSDGGFVVEGRLGAVPWRLEWGPSQRPYVKGTELRLRAELGLPNELQALVLNRPLQEQMEKEVFEQFVEGVQTRIDSQTPPEMRWLVMFPRLSGSELGALKERYVALGSSKHWLTAWLEGPLTAALRSSSIAPERPLVLMISRGRLALRTALESPDERDLEPWIRLFEAAMREGRRAASQFGDPGTPSTQPSLWSASAMPSDDERPK